MSERPSERIRVLRLAPTISESSAPYNQFSLPLADTQDITFCVYFKPSIPVSPKIKLFSGDGTLLGFFRVLRSAFKAKEYDVVHAHLPSVAFLLIFWLMFTSWDVMRRTVHTVHSSYPNYKLSNRLLVLPILVLYRRIVFCSRSSFESFPKVYRWLTGNRARVIQNSVDLDRIERTAGVSSNQAENVIFRIVTVGRLISIKRPLSILRAFHQAGLPEAELIFIGEGPLREQIVAESESLGLRDRVQITGLINREEVYEYLSGANLFISASTVEGLPVAVLEAMACRCPVLLSDIPPHREIAKDTDLIPLIPPGDVAGFSQEIRRLQQLSSSDRAAVGWFCRRLVEEKFSLSTMHRQYEDIYAQVRN
jgi:glycosyltransferase involved in cell wall biosynthesis